jgi:hypothetical protein
MSSTVFLTLSKFDLDAWMQLDRPDERARIAASGDTVPRETAAAKAAATTDAAQVEAVGSQATEPSGDAAASSPASSDVADGSEPPALT